LPIARGPGRALTRVTSRRPEAMPGPPEFRGVVPNLVASETARGSLEEEVAKSVASSVAAGGAAAQTQAARVGAGDGGRRAPGGQQLPGRGGRDSAAAPDTARAAPARAAKAARGGQGRMPPRPAAHHPP